jgi:hypothetical protein
MGGLVGHVLDEGKAEFVLEVGLPELLVVVDVRFEVRVEQFLDRCTRTPAALIANPPSSSAPILHVAAIARARSIPTRSSCSISVRSFSSPSFPPYSSFPNNIILINKKSELPHSISNQKAFNIRISALRSA